MTHRKKRILWGVVLLCVLALPVGNFRALQNATPKAFLRQGDVASIVEDRIDAAENIKDNLFGNGIRVCLGTTAPSVAAYADRIFISSDEPDTVAGLVESMQQSLPDTAKQIVFLTDSRDTRFEACGVVRPLLQETG